MESFFTEWTLLSAGSSCNNKKTDFRYKNEALTDCKAFCKNNGALALVYIEKSGNCACCEHPPELFNCSDCSVYQLGISYCFYFSFSIFFILIQFRIWGCINIFWYFFSNNSVGEKSRAGSRKESNKHVFNNTVGNGSRKGFTYGSGILGMEVRYGNIAGERSRNDSGEESCGGPGKGSGRVYGSGQWQSIGFHFKNFTFYR